MGKRRLREIDLPMTTKVAPVLGKIESRKRKRHRMGLLDGTADSMDMNLSKLREITKAREARRPAVHGVTKSWTRLSG